MLLQARTRTDDVAEEMGPAAGRAGVAELAAQHHGILHLFGHGLHVFPERGKMNVVFGQQFLTHLHDARFFRIRIRGIETLHTNNLTRAEMFGLIPHQFQQLLAEGRVVPLLFLVVQNVIMVPGPAVSDKAEGRRAAVPIIARIHIIRPVAQHAVHVDIIAEAAHAAEARPEQARPVRPLQDILTFRRVDAPVKDDIVNAEAPVNLGDLGRLSVTERRVAAFGDTAQGAGAAMTHHQVAHQRLPVAHIFFRQGIPRANEQPPALDVFFDKGPLLRAQFQIVFHTQGLRVHGKGGELGIRFQQVQQLVHKLQQQQPGLFEGVAPLAVPVGVRYDMDGFSFLGHDKALLCRLKGRCSERRYETIFEDRFTTSNFKIGNCPRDDSGSGYAVKKWE